MIKKILFGLLAGLLAGNCALARERPNILLLMSEDMSPRVGAFGDSIAVTPSLDALAAEGLRYPNTFTTAGVCAPSRASHILGMHQISTGGQHMRTSSAPDGGYFAVPPAEVKAYPELLRAAGYYTYTDRKLDYQFSGALSGSGPFTIWDAEGVKHPGRAGRARGQPFFGFLNFLATHESGVFRPLGTMPHSPIHFLTQVMRWWVMDEPPAAVVSPAALLLPPYYPDTPVVRQDMARHYNNIAQMDREVAALLAQLEADGLADSTIVIWTTDHGDGLPRAKRELYDSGLNVPMIIRWPEAFRPEGVVAGAIDTRLVSFVDLAPAILGMAGASLPEYLHGQDFTVPDAPIRQYIFASRDRIDEVPDRQRAVRDQRFKYIRSWRPEQIGGHELAFRDNLEMVSEMRELYLAGKLNAAQRIWFEAPGEERLFDLERDPFELEDVSGDPNYRDDLLRLRTVLDQRLAEIGDWSEQTEAAMVESFTQDGERRVTQQPLVSVAAGKLTLKPVGVGSSLGYRLDGGPWRLYTSPVDIKGARQVEVRSVRYGWEASKIKKIKVSETAR